MHALHTVHNSNRDALFKTSQMCFPEQEKKLVCTVHNPLIALDLRLKYPFLIRVCIVKSFKRFFYIYVACNHLCFDCHSSDTFRSCYCQWRSLLLVLLNLREEADTLSNLNTNISLYIYNFRYIKTSFTTLISRLHLQRCLAAIRTTFGRNFLISAWNNLGISLQQWRG